jgi:AcrR family transcriptional regulator
MGDVMSAFESRKKPIQERSKATVEAILEATIRVLRGTDFDSLTTTKVADVAGVGVGTLYQYFPSKEALLFALLEREMELFEAALMQSAAGAGVTLVEQVEAIVDALIRFKRDRADITVALHAQMPRVDGVKVVRATMRRIVTMLTAMLSAHLPNAEPPEIERMAMTIATSVQGTVDGALDIWPARIKQAAFRDDLVRLVLGYLRESGWKEPRS